MPYSSVWSPTPPTGLTERARTAWTRSDWATVVSELIDKAVEHGDAVYLAPVVESEVQMLDGSYLLPHLDRLERLPAGPFIDAALAYLAVREETGDRGAISALAAVQTLTAVAPSTAASVAVAAGMILADRGRLAEAAGFLEAAREAIARTADAVAEPIRFGVMSLAVLVEWDTYGGTEAFEEVSAALAAPRARNLLRAHHAAPLLAVGHVLAARGDFGAAAVSIARAVSLLPEGSLVRASALGRLALVRFRQGDWQAARRAADEAVAPQSAESAWYRGLRAALDALLPALAGDLAEAEERIALARAALAAASSVQAESLLLHARIAYAIGARDWSGMVQLLEAAAEPGYRRIYTDDEWYAMQAMALRNAGRLVRYRELLEEWGRRDGASQHPYHLTHLALRAQLDGDLAGAVAATEAARASLTDREDPLGRAWVRIVVGRIVSLSGDATEGIASYEAARAELTEIGARAFVALCTRSIEATASELARTGGGPLQVLTAQQRRVAELVADGYTSAEIAEILYLSKKTIDFHVANVLSRLSLSNRRELKRFLQAR